MLYMMIVGLVLLQAMSAVHYDRPQEVHLYEQNIVLQYDYVRSRDHCLSHLEERTLARALNEYQALFMRRTYQQWYCSIPSGTDQERVLDELDNVVSIDLVEAAPHVDRFDPKRAFSYVSLYFPEESMGHMSREQQEEEFGKVFNASYGQPMVFTVQFKEHTMKKDWGGWACSRWDPSCK